MFSLFVVIVWLDEIYNKIYGHKTDEGYIYQLSPIQLLQYVE